MQFHSIKTDLKLLPPFPQKFSPSQVSLYSVITSKATIHLLEEYCQDLADSLLSWTVSKYKTHFTILVSSHFFWFCFLNSYSSLRHFWLRNCIHTIQTNTNHEELLSAFNYMLISHPHCDFQFPQTVGKSLNHISQIFLKFFILYLSDSWQMYLSLNISQTDCFLRHWYMYSDLTHFRCDYTILIANNHSPCPTVSHIFFK